MGFGGSASVPKPNSNLEMGFLSRLNMDPRASAYLSGPETTPPNLGISLSPIRSNFSAPMIDTSFNTMPFMDANQLTRGALVGVESQLPTRLRLTDDNPLWTTSAPENYAKNYFDMVYAPELGKGAAQSWLGGNTGTTGQSTAASNYLSNLAATGYSTATLQGQDYYDRLINNVLNERNNLFGNSVNLVGSTNLSEINRQMANNQLRLSAEQANQNAMLNTNELNQRGDIASGQQQLGLGQLNLGGLGQSNSYRLGAAGALNSFGLGSAGMLSDYGQNQQRLQLEADAARAQSSASALGGIGGLAGGLIGGIKGKKSGGKWSF